MKISTRKIPSRFSIGMAILAAFLMMFASPLRADDDKDKKKDSTTTRPAPAQKPAKTEKSSSHSAGTGSSQTGSGSSSTSGTQSTTHHDKNRGTGPTGTSSTGASTGGTGSGGTGAVTDSTSHVKHHGTDSTGSTSGSTTSTSSASSTGSHTGSGSAATVGTPDPGKHKGKGTVSSESAITTGDAKHAKVTAAPTTLVPGLKRNANGRPESFRSHDGSEARFGHDGRLREVRTREMTIYHGPRGFRRVIVERPDHSRIVVNRFGYGYVQRPFMFRNREFAARTYYYNGRPYALYYQRYPYRGLYLNGYTPYGYYRPAFYGWAYHPWGAPVYYRWGWASSPWYGHYNYYFQPYPVYPSASFWLTDYLIASSLQAAYTEQHLASQNAYFADPSGPVVLSPDVKQAIANEVQSQLALENSESQASAGGRDIDIDSSGLPRILAETSERNPHVFVVGSPLTVTDASGQDCMLTEGDVLRLGNPPPPDATSATLSVYASKNQDCLKGNTVTVGLADLQEMQNHLRAGIDQGLQQLQSHQGGLPAPPAAAAAPPVPSSFSPIAPPPDPNVTGELQQQAREANAADQAVVTEAKQTDSSIDVDSDTSGNPPAQISVGQTTSEVRAALGAPKRVARVGTKVIYFYPDMKITFINGKVSDVE